MSTAIVLDGVRKVYPTANGGVVALDNVTLAFEAGQFVSIIGSNGSGKTTLLNVISGAVTPTEGAVLFDGRDVTGIPEWKRADAIARVFQRPEDGSAGDLTIAENLGLAASSTQFSSLRWCVKRQRLASQRDVLAELDIGLKDRMHDNANALSGGQRQALSVIIATLRGASILLLDEHVSALDPSASRKVLESTGELVDKTDMTTLMVTHSIQDAIAFGTRLIMLHRGCVVLDLGQEVKQRLTVEEVVKMFQERIPEGHATSTVLLNR